MSMVRNAKVTAALAFIESEILTSPIVHQIDYQLGVETPKDEAY